MGSASLTALSLGHLHTNVVISPDQSNVVAFTLHFFSLMIWPQNDAIVSLADQTRPAVTYSLINRNGSLTRALFFFSFFPRSPGPVTSLLTRLVAFVPWTFSLIKQISRFSSDDFRSLAPNLAFCGRDRQSGARGGALWPLIPSLWQSVARHGSIHLCYDDQSVKLYKIFSWKRMTCSSINVTPAATGALFSLNQRKLN